MKKQIIAIIGVVMATLLFTACGPVYETVYNYEPPSSTHGKLCVQQCQQSKNLCQRLCNAETSECRADAKRQMHERYMAYVKQQEGAGRIAKRDEKSFYKKPHCATASCHCEKDMSACVELCGGRAIPHRRCVSNCGSKQATLKSSDILNLRKLRLI